VHPHVYYAEGLLGLNTEPSGSLHSRVLDYLHVTNVADVRVGSVHGMSLVSMEQLLLWDPAHIIVWSGYPGGVGLPVSGGAKSTYAHIMSDVVWSRLSAVRAGRVYQVPSLPFGWIDRPPSSNCLLGVVWLCWKLHPELLTFDFQVAVREYFELFYHVRLSGVEELLR
jgi:iron complex transport system substrate-binding protein